MPTNIANRFASIQKTMKNRFDEAADVVHHGDRGENREHILRNFLTEHLPGRYGVAKGEIMFPNGDRSHSADVIIYDAIKCPLLYSEQTAILPSEGVFGIIEVKSGLTKAEFIDAANKIATFKEQTSRTISARKTADRVELGYPSRPFGFIFGGSLAGNSLSSLKNNYSEFSQSKPANFWPNLTVVLDCGMLYPEGVNLSRGTKEILIDTDCLCLFIEKWEYNRRTKNEEDEILIRIVNESSQIAFGLFYLHLLSVLGSMSLYAPDLHRYLTGKFGTAPMVSVL